MRHPSSLPTMPLSPMQDHINTTQARAATESESINRPSSATIDDSGTLTASPVASTALHRYQNSILLPSPPTSPPRKVEEIGHPRAEAPPSPPSRDSGVASMLQAASTITTAKVDINLLLKPNPSPPPSSSGADQPRGFPQSWHARSLSVPAPPPQQHFQPATPSHKTSISASSVLPAPTSQPAFEGFHSHHASLGSQYGHRSTLSGSHHHLPPHLQQRRPFLPPLPMPGGQIAGHSTGRPQGPPHHGSPHQQQIMPSPMNQSQKRPPPSGPHPAASPAKRQSKWTPEEDALIIELRGSGMKWEEISRRLPGRSAISCRLHYQNYLERRSEWDEERKNRLARLYERLKPEMWGPLAAELGIPWRAAEAMHWQLGEADMARRAGVVPFSLAASASGSTSSVASAGSATAVQQQHQPAAAPSHQSPHSHYPLTGASGLPGTPGSTSLPGIGMSVGHSPRQHSRSDSFGRRTSAESAHFSGGPGPVLGPGHGQGLLPSLAELERGLTAFDDRGGRYADSPHAHADRYADSLGRRYV